jgi:hypothetical protein
MTRTDAGASGYRRPSGDAESGPFSQEALLASARRFGSVHQLDGLNAAVRRLGVSRRQLRRMGGLTSSVLGVCSDYEPDEGTYSTFCEVRSRESVRRCADKFRTNFGRHDEEEDDEESCRATQEDKAGRGTQSEGKETCSGTTTT